MNTRWIILVILFWSLAVSCIPAVLAVEPSWTYSITNESKISAIAVSSDGSTIIVAADSLWIFSKDGFLQKNEKYGDKVVLAPSGRYAASSFGGTVYFFSTPLTTGTPDPSTMAKMWEYECSDPVRSIEMTDDGSVVIVRTQGTAWYILKPLTKEMSSSNEFYNAILKISHDGSRIVGISGDTVRLYSRNGKVTKKIVMENITSSDIAFTFLSQTVPLMVFNNGPRIRSYDLSMGTELWNTKIAGNLDSLVMTPSGSFVVAGTEYGDIFRYDDRGNLNWTYTPDRETSLNSGINNLAISKDGGLVAATTYDGNVLLLNGRGTLIGSYPVHELIESIAMSQDGSILLVGSDRNIYAFLTGYSASARTSSAAKTPTLGSLNTSGKNITYPHNLTRQPVIPTFTKTSATGTITELPTEYSIIRTPTKSPLGLGSGIIAFVISIFMFRSRFT
jgi:WD40 repeat protein